MKIKLNIKSIIFMTIIAIATLLFINISFAANTGKVLVETAKLREQANADSKVLELASLGEEVEILNEEEDWYKVKYKNITGYIRKDLIEVENKEKVIENYNKTYNNKVLSDFINTFWNDKKMIRTFPNIKIEDKEYNTVYIDSLLPNIQPYYKKIF